MATQADRIARKKLIDYATKFLMVTARDDQPIDVTPRQIAEFASQVREGCMQDLLRLISSLANDLNVGGKDALLSLAGAIQEAESIELWGLPDCACKKSECVYCGRGFAIPSTLATAQSKLES